MQPITQKVHAQKKAEGKACPTCYQPIAKGCGCKSRGPLKKMSYSSPVYKQSCKY